MSNQENEALLEDFYEQFLEQGFLPHVAEVLAHQRLEERSEDTEKLE